MSRSIALLILIALVPACDPGSPAAPVDEPVSVIAESPAAQSQRVQSTWPTAADPGMPFYTRIEPEAPYVYTDSGWAVIPFYRDPDCVPEGFNLLQFFDAPAAFGCPHRVSGHSVWHESVGAGAPRVVVVRGMGAVPVWFAPQSAILEALEDGELTIGEIEGLTGLVKGVATRFTEMLHPHPLPVEMGGGGHPVPKVILDARGTLDDGRSFSVQVTRTGDRPPSVRIRIH